MQHPIVNGTAAHLLLLAFARLSCSRNTHQVDLCARHQSQRERLARDTNQSRGKVRALIVGFRLPATNLVWRYSVQRLGCTPYAHDVLKKYLRMKLKRQVIRPHLKYHHDPLKRHRAGNSITAPWLSESPSARA